MSDKSNSRPYVTMFQGEERLVEAKSREAVRDHLLAPILAEISPPIDSIRIAKAKDVAMLMKRGVKFEEAGAPEDTLLTVEDIAEGMLLYANGTEITVGNETITVSAGLHKVEAGAEGNLSVNLINLYDGQATVDLIIDEKSIVHFRRPTDEERQSYLDLPLK